jgi:endo-alpha-1,4-polygalactosaminidase (GH114 family)
MKREILKVALVLAFFIGSAADILAQTQPRPGTVRQQGQDVDLDRSRQGSGGGAALVRESTNPAQAMRDLVRDISKYARRFNRNFSVVTQGGLELLEKIDAVDGTRKSPASTYMRSLDGINIQGLNFHPPLAGKTDTATEVKIRDNMVRLAELGKRRGLKVFVTDFAVTAQAAQKSFQLNQAKGFISFAAKNAGTSYIFDRIPKFPARPINENPKNMVGLKGVRNYLYLTDSSNFDRQQDFVIALSNTNFDAVIVDVFHRGRRPFVKAAIQGMKFKKLGARRLVLAYMNIGAAETYRYYWKDNWREGSPNFIGSPTAGNPDKYYIEFWRPGWRKIITGNTKSYLYGIVAQGFDGVILDGLDSYKFFEGG